MKKKDGSYSGIHGNHVDNLYIGERSRTEDSLQTSHTHPFITVAKMNRNAVPCTASWSSPCFDQRRENQECRNDFQQSVKEALRNFLHPIEPHQQT